MIHGLAGKKLRKGRKPDFTMIISGVLLMSGLDVLSRVCCGLTLPLSWSQSGGGSVALWSPGDALVGYIHALHCDTDMTRP